MGVGIAARTPRNDPTARDVPMVSLFRNLWIRNVGAQTAMKLRGIVTGHASTAHSAIDQSPSTAISSAAESGWISACPSVGAMAGVSEFFDWIFVEDVKYAFDGLG